MAGIKEEKKIYLVGIYCRLSKDDGTDNESASIATQKSILTDYVKKQGWHIAKTYVDDGYSGTNFQRPSFQNMIKDIELNVIVARSVLEKLGNSVDVAMTGKAMRGNTVSQGDFGIVALEPSWITSNQIEAARIAMTRYIKRGGKVWIKIFPDKPVTEKPAETRMGSGKGSPEYWVAVVKPGRVLFEIADVSEETAREALRLAAHKLPVKCKFVKREGLEEA